MTEANQAGPEESRKKNRRRGVLNPDQRAELLRMGHDDMLIDVDDMALLFKTTRGGISQMLRRGGGRLPPSVPGLGRRLLWHLGSVRNWLRALANGEVSGPRKGRPRQ